jgi:hypothetical protein
MLGRSSGAQNANNVTSDYRSRLTTLFRRCLLAVLLYSDVCSALIVKVKTCTPSNVVYKYYLPTMFVCVCKNLLEVQTTVEAHTWNTDSSNINMPDKFPSQEEINALKPQQKDATNGWIHFLSFFHGKQENEMTCNVKIGLVLQSSPYMDTILSYPGSCYIKHFKIQW